MADKKISEQLGAAIFEAGKEIVGKKLSKAQYDKSYKTTIVGCNRYFTDDVPKETQAELIKKYNIPEVSVSGVYYTFRINGNWYVKSSNNDFKLYEEVVVRVPNGNWDNMFIEVQRDTVVEGGVGKNVGNASEIFNNYSGSNANVIDGAYAAHAEGSQNTITGASLASHAEGSENRISNSRGAHAEGNFTSVSISDYSHVEGESNHIYGAKWVHAGGYGCNVFKDGGFTHGINTMVGGVAAAAFGSETYAGGKDQFVAGRGNKTDEEDKYALIIGNGTGTRGLSGFAPSNALTLDWEGNLWVAGTISAEGGGTGGKTYTAGDGISLTGDKISVKPATKSAIGGVKAGEGIEIASDGTISIENKQSLTAGDGIDITNDIVSVKVGNGLEVSSDGTISVTGGGSGGEYTAGSGIEITDENAINLKQATSSEIGGIVLGDGLEYDEATGKTNTVPNIQQAVILQEKDAKYLLHEYTTVEYIAGNRIGYAGGQNQIIAQGYIIYKKEGTAPNGAKIASITSVNLSELPDIQMYTDMSFPELAYCTIGTAYRITRSYVKFKASTSTYDNYDWKNVKTDGSETIVRTISNYNSFNYGVAFVWNMIQPPGYTTGGVTYPYGCVICTYAFKIKSSNTQYQFYVESGNFFNIGFASEAEYNAAVGLTYEPQTLVNVEETITEV